ncbi:DUF1648 domain-containing protein [Mariniluteicoccus flavus]
MTTTPAATSADAALRPQPRRAFVISAVVVLAAVIGAVALVQGARDELPDPIATHWGADGRADGFMALTRHLVFGGVFTLVMTGFLLGVGAAVRQLRAMASVAAGLGVFLAVVLIGSTLTQRGLADARDARDQGSLLIGAAAGAVVGVLVWLAVRTHVVPAAARPAALPPDAAVLGVGDAARVAWTGRTRVGRWAVVVMAATAALLLGLAIVFSVLGNGQAGAFVLIVLVAIALLGSSTWSRVIVDRGGVTVRGPGRLRWVHVPLATIESAGVGTVDPLGEFGGYGIRGGLDGSAGVVTSAGPALRVDRAGEKPLWVTVDDADGAAAVLNTLLRRQGAPGGRQGFRA